MSTATLTPTPHAPSGFPYEEKHAGLRLGFTKDDLREFRQKNLTGGVDFITHKKRIFLSAAALQKLCADSAQPTLQKNAPTCESSTAGDPGAEKSTVPKTEELIVIRANLANKRMILACAQNDTPENPKKPLRVRVQSQKHFVPRMIVPANLVPGYQDLYDLAQGLPRKKGKW